VASGIIFSTLVVTAAPLETLDRLVLASELMAWLRAESLAIRAALLSLEF